MYNGRFVDMWSVGCIFAELLGRKPLSDEANQLATILDVLGSPHVDRELHHLPRQYITSLPHSAGKPLRSIYPSASDEALELLSRRLCGGRKKAAAEEGAAENAAAENAAAATAAATATDT